MLYGIAIMLRWIFILLVLTTVGLAGTGIYWWITDPSGPPRDSFTLDNPNRDLSEQPVGETLLSYRITNGSKQPRRILGLAEG